MIGGRGGLRTAAAQPQLCPRVTLPREPQQHRYLRAAAPGRDASLVSVVCCPSRISDNGGGAGASERTAAGAGGSKPSREEE